MKRHVISGVVTSALFFWANVAWNIDNVISRARQDNTVLFLVTATPFARLEQFQVG